MYTKMGQRLPIISYKFRCYPNAQAQAYLEQALESCRLLYNECLAERKRAYEYSHRWPEHKRVGFAWPNFDSQKEQLPEIKEANPEYLHIGSQDLAGCVCSLREHLSAVSCANRSQ